MDHSFYGKVVSCLKINGAYMNETVTNAAIAASYKVPVGLGHRAIPVCAGS